jgi:hypothetical protein
MSFSNSATVQSTTLAANTPVKIANASPGLRILIISNNGTGSLVWKPGSAPASATDGISLDAAGGAGGQGGSIVLTGDAAIGDAIFAWSTAGTTVSVCQGGTHP